MYGLWSRTILHTGTIKQKSQTVQEYEILISFDSSDEAQLLYIGSVQVWCCKSGAVTKTDDANCNTRPVSVSHDTEHNEYKINMQDLHVHVCPVHLSLISLFSLKQLLPRFTRLNLNKASIIAPVRR